MILRPFAPYIAGAAIVALLVAGWQYSVRQAYQRGYSAAEAAQEAVNAEHFRKTLESYNETTSRPIDVDTADCILRELAANRTGENCRDLPSQPE